MHDAKFPAAPPRIAGLILAGGHSSRFGGEKAVAALDGRPLLLWCAEALRAAGAVVAVNPRQDSDAEALARSHGLPILLDDPALPAGPLTGVLAGLAWARAEGFDLLLTLPCDTPLVTAAALRALLDAATDAPAAYALANGRPQGLCAAWRTDLHDILATPLRRGDHPAVHRLLADLGAAPVAFDDAHAFRNINTPADLSDLEGSDAAAHPPSR